MHRIALYILSLWFSLMALDAGGQHIVFNHLTTAEGLSQCSVNSLYIDECGTVWIATRDGLNRYNGLDVKTYRLEKDNPNSLFCNTVLHLAGNKQGKIYLHCEEGVAEFDQMTERFTTLLKGSARSVFYKDGLYVGRRNEVLRYNEQRGEMESYYRLVQVESSISCFYQKDSLLYLGTTNDGVFCLNMADRSLTHPISRGNIPSIYGDSEGVLWIGSWEHGLFRIEPNGRVTNYRHEPRAEYTLSSDFVRACCEDNLGNLWIGTADGLDRYDRQSGRFHHHTDHDGPESGLTHTSVWCIERDPQGTLWLGTYFGGVNYFNPEYEIFTRYAYTANDRQGLSYPVVGRMVEDESGNLWIGTEGGGLNYYNRHTREFQWYRSQDGGNTIAHNNVKALYYDTERQTLWIGTHLGGLNRLDVRTRRFTHYRMVEGDNRTLPSDIVRDIAPFGHRLVVATQNGVCLFLPDKGICQRLFLNTPEGERIRAVASVCFDREGTLWMAATGEGVYSYRFDTGKLTNYRHLPDNPHSLSSNNVNNIFCDHEGTLWFGTSGCGLDRYRPDGDDFENFDQRCNGLGNDCVYRVEQSPEGGHLLLITNGGFSVFYPKEGRFANYHAENGFPLSSINENALCVTRDGEVFLGSTRGMVSFYARKLDFSAKPYRIYLSRLFVNGQEQHVGDDSGVLKRSLRGTEEITLRAGQSMFSIEFVTSNYVVSNSDEILYRLEGFSKVWNRTPDNHTITYTNLNPGTYRLVLKPAHADTLCPPTTLTIHVLPAIYKTWWAKLLYLLTIASLLLYVVKTYQTRIKLRESLKYEQQHLKDIEALNQSKLRFFTNISHEFRTPLTLIVSQVETLMQMQNFTPALYNKVLGIYKNSLQLRGLITELLDFRKQEQGHMKIKVRPHNLVDFLYENYLLFNEYAISREIEMRFEKECDNLEVWYDQKQMLKVVNNLLSNAFKHSRPQGVITLGVQVGEGKAIFWVADTGSGIPADERDKIFDRFYQIVPEGEADAKKQGTGIGLALSKGIVELHHGHIHVESEVGQGTRFVVSLPLGCNAFAADEIGRREDSIQLQEQNPAIEDGQMLEELEENSPKKRIPDAEMLIVEDNKAICQMLSQLFAPFYNVVTAYDGLDAWEKIQRHAPHIVLSDVVMPRMSGTELCKRIKEDYNTCHIPVVLLTAHTAIEQNMEGLRIGADDYITKPFHTSLLISRCNNLVNSRVLLQEKFSRQPQAAPQMLATNPLDKDWLDKAIRVIDEHLSDSEFSVPVFAREMGMARTNLFTKLKAITGQTPNDFILTIRLKKGAWMLRNHPEWNVTEIADKTGFSSSRYFAKCFKDVYHVSPMGYRRGEESGPETAPEAERPQE